MSHSGNQTIGVFHLVLLFIMSVGLTNHVTIIPALMEAAGRDAWLSIILATFIFGVWVWLIAYIVKHTQQQHIGGWLRAHFGRLTAGVFVCVVCLFVFVAILVTIIDMTSWTNVMYLPFTPQIVVISVFMTVCFVAASSNIVTLAIINGILLPLVIVFGYFVFSANLSEKDYSLLFPILENGMGPVWEGVIYSGAGLTEVFIVILLQHRLKSTLKYWHLLILVLILGYLTIGPVTGGIAAFGPAEVAQQRFPAYDLWSLVSMGRFIEHVDFFSIYQWLAGAFIRLSLGLYIIVDLLNLQGRKRMLLLLVMTMLIIFSILLPFSDVQFLAFIVDIFLPASFIFFVACSFFVGICVFIANYKQAHSEGYL